MPESRCFTGGYVKSVFKIILPSAKTRSLPFLMLTICFIDNPYSSIASAFIFNSFGFSSNKKPNTGLLCSAVLIEILFTVDIADETIPLFSDTGGTAASGGGIVGYTVLCSYYQLEDVTDRVEWAKRATPWRQTEI